MTPDQPKDAASDLVESVKKQATKTKKTAGKVISKVKKASRKAVKRSARAQTASSAGYSESASRFIGRAKAAFSDVYGWAGDSSTWMAKARKAGFPSEYVNERSLIVAAVGLGVSVAIGAIVLGYGGLGVKQSTAKSRSSRKR